MPTDKNSPRATPMSCETPDVGQKNDNEEDVITNLFGVLCLIFGPLSLLASRPNSLCRTVSCVPDGNNLGVSK